MENIDKKYADKLKGFEIKPSDRVNAIFQQKIKEKQKKVVFFNLSKTIGIAASIILTALISIYYYNDTNIPTVAQEITKELPLSNDSSNKSITTPTIILEADQIKTIVDKPFIVNKQLALNSKSNVKPSKSTESNLKIMEIRGLENATTKSIESKIDIKTNLKVDNNTLAFNTPKENEEILVYLTPLPIKEKSKVDSEIQILDNSNSNTFGDEIYDKSLITKVLEEVKGLKRGESVDFEKLGFKSIDELALNNEGFIASETRQIREKVYWIKSKLNNK